MQREQFGTCLDAIGERLRERLRDARVDAHALALQKAVVGDIADERVLEAIDRVVAAAAPEHQSARFERRERLREPRAVDRRDRGQQRVIELAPDARADLRDGLDRREMIETRHQRIMQRERNRERRSASVPASRRCASSVEPERSQ
jgi:hypothetical protein